jgi:hypothetical protein
MDLPITPQMHADAINEQRHIAIKSIVKLASRGVLSRDEALMLLTDPDKGGLTAEEAEIRLGS